MISVRRVLFTAPRDSKVIRCCYSTQNQRPKPQSQWPKPTEVPFQPKLANAVNLIGRVQSPVQFQTSPDGNPWAATVITSSLLIPVVFEGDLAHTAFSHLKQNDVVHIAGQLTTHPPPPPPPPPHSHSQQLQSHFQVMVQSLNFVKGYPQLNNESVTSSKQKLFASYENEEDDIKSSKKNIYSKQSEEPEIDNSWKDLLNNPSEWWDVRSTGEYPIGTAFERKTDGELLFIDSTTPKWLQEKSESLTSNLKPEQSITTAKKGPDSILSSWKDLLHDPKQWWDFRDSKCNGLVNPRHPDFKRKDGSVPLWLNTAPKWLLSKLKELEFDIPVNSKQAKDKGDQSWNDLVQNPAKWWDNRLDKKNERAPDFKHKETGEALWLRGSPSWVLAKLPPVKQKQSAVTSRKQIPVS